MHSRMLKYLLPILLLVCRSAVANGVVAGSVTYSWISDSTYQVVFKLYNDCDSNAAPAYVNLCVYNSCNNSSFSKTMYKLQGSIRSGLPNGAEVPIGCTPIAPTRCTDVNSIYPGFKEWWYVDTVTLPARCTAWSFRVALSSRSALNNIANSDFFVETTFNNQLSLQNYSPEFGNLPMIFTCLNMPYVYDIDAADADNDSLHYTIIDPQTVYSLNCPSTPDTVQYKNLAPPINLTDNPFQTNNSFSFNDTNGKANFTVTSAGSNLMTVRIDEYRNGTLIGSVLRDFQVYAFACSVIAPQLENGTNAFMVTDTIAGGAAGDSVIGRISTCVDADLDHYFYLKTIDSISAQWYLSDSISTDLPGAKVEYFNEGNDSVMIHLQWTPSLSDSGSHSYRIWLTDSACRPPVTGLTYIRTFDVHVGYGVSAGNDTAICAHEPIVLSPQNPYGLLAPGTYTWRMLPGSTGTLSCTNCYTAYGYPAPSASYEITSSAAWCPHVYKDTINVSTLSTPVTYPVLNISVAPDSNIWPYLMATFTANTSNCNYPVYQWRKNGIDITGANGKTYSSTELKDGDIITCHLQCNDTCPSPRDTVSNAIKMNVATDINNVNNNRASVDIHPNPAHDLINITIHSESYQEYRVELVNVLGNRVADYPLSKTTGQVDISSLPTAVYTVRITGDGSLIGLSKLVKR